MAQATYTRRPKGSGMVRRLPSGRWQAQYTGPDGRRRPAPQTFDTKGDAEAWLAAEHGDARAGVWAPPEPASDRRQTLREYAERWLALRDLRPRTRALYRSLLDDHVLPDLGSLPLDRIRPGTVQSWFARLTPDRPTTRAHAYGLLRTIMGSAFSDDLIGANPCRIRGGSSVRKQHASRPATLAELEAIVQAMPDRYRLAVLFAAWLGLRFGELTALTRGDVDLDLGVVTVAKGVVRADGQVVVGQPKTAAGLRTVAIPPDLIPTVRRHLREYVEPAPGALLFPAKHGGHLAPSTLYGVFYPAREAAGRPDLRWHDLRHTGAVLAAAAGATLPDLMHRLGHTTPQAAMVYQHAAQDRDRLIAAALSDIRRGDVQAPLPLRRGTRRRSA